MRAELLKVFWLKLALDFDIFWSKFALTAHVVHPGEEPEPKRILEPFSTMERSAKILEIVFRKFSWIFFQENELKTVY